MKRNERSIFNTLLDCMYCKNFAVQTLFHKTPELRLVFDLLIDEIDSGCWNLLDTNSL